MSDRFSVISIEQLFSIIQKDYKKGYIFGIPKELFFIPNKADKFRMNRFGKLLETPIGVAAGPHSQMTQNIISAWLCGARYIELKTIQTLDELNVSKPCIDIQDEGYNCEWSQELKIHESFEQYLDAWIIIHILKHQFGWDKTEAGVIFNMSVGYNMEGILHENVQWFFNKMKNSKDEKDEKIFLLSLLYPEVLTLNIPDCISNNITLSTMHGCPPEEIEKIGLYLIENKKLHTTIKLNPTLIGSEKLRTILNKKSGFQTIVPDEAFAHDLKYPDALKLIRSLQKAAQKNKVFFGLKLTNTLEAENHKNIFPPNEKMMYMSGRALHPISINLADILQKEFKGTLDISFSAGADCFNLADILSSGLKPVTVCSDILKPGGYGRLSQYLDILRQANIEMDNSENTLLFLSNYASQTIDNEAYKRDPFFTPSIKTKRKLNQFDCIQAPCVETCPTNQDIPEYMYYTAKGDFQKAYEVIMRTNPFPNVLGMVCDHLCQTKCTRTNYDEALLIRDIKRFVADQENNEQYLIPQAKNNQKVAIIGAGPSGLACAYFLVLAGFEINVFETKSIAGGMISDAIPAFRLTDTAIKKDIERIQKLGVNIHYNFPIDSNKFNELQKENDYVFIAIGAQKAKKLEIENADAAGILDPLKFLSDIRRGIQTTLGKNILVIGGGNTAMDVARTAQRIIGSGGKVTVVYRRTIHEMPADKEELKDLIKEGITVIELTAPEKIILENNTVKALQCSKMELGPKDSSGRAKPIKIKDSTYDIPCDTVIPALGQNISLDFIDLSPINAEEQNYETILKNVFIGGDAMRGGATVIKAVADGRKIADKIIHISNNKNNLHTFITDKNISMLEHMTNRSKRVHRATIDKNIPDLQQGFNLMVETISKEEAIKEASRCLFCDDVCNICVTVCPNRANYSYEIQPLSGKIYKAVKNNDNTSSIIEHDSFSFSQKYQVLNISDFCNECGNCTTFCPSSGQPFADKPKFHLTLHSFKQAKNGYFLNKLKGPKSLLYKQNNLVSSIIRENDHFIFRNYSVQAIVEGKTFKVTSVKFLGNDIKEQIFDIIPEMCMLYDAADNLYA